MAFIDLSVANPTIFGSYLCSTEAPTPAPPGTTPAPGSGGTAVPSASPTFAPTATPTGRKPTEVRISVFLVGVRDDLLPNVDGLKSIMEKQVFFKTKEAFHEQALEFRVGEILPKSWKSHFPQTFGSKFKFFAYHGSTTAPPCKQNVGWMVASEPSLVGESSLRKLRELEMWSGQTAGKNNRPAVMADAQPLARTQGIRMSDAAALRDLQCTSVSSSTHCKLISLKKKPTAPSLDLNIVFRLSCSTSNVVPTAQTVYIPQVSASTSKYYIIKYGMLGSVIAGLIIAALSVLFSKHSLGEPKKVARTVTKTVTLEKTVHKKALVEHLCFLIEGHTNGHLETEGLSSFKLSADRAFAVKEAIEKCQKNYNRSLEEENLTRNDAKIGSLPSRVPHHLRMDYAGRGGSVPVVSGSSEENMRVEVHVSNRLALSYLFQHHKKALDAMFARQNYARYNIRFDYQKYLLVTPHINFKENTAEFKDENTVELVKTIAELVMALDDLVDSCNADVASAPHHVNVATIHDETSVDNHLDHYDENEIKRQAIAMGHMSPGRQNFSQAPPGMTGSQYGHSDYAGGMGTPMRRSPPSQFARQQSPRRNGPAAYIDDSPRHGFGSQPNKPITFQTLSNTLDEASGGSRGHGNNSRPPLPPPRFPVPNPRATLAGQRPQSPPLSQSHQQRQFLTDHK